MEFKRETKEENSAQSVLSSRDLGRLSYSLHELINGRDVADAGEDPGSKEDGIHAIVFALGTFLLMVCLKRFLVEQWRAWVFLLLNVILLAIVFMSMRPSYFDTSSKNSKSERKVEEVKNENEEEKEIEEEKECYKKQCWNDCVHDQVLNETEEEEEEEEQVQMLSKEELNERVEAFIAMFRKHLISDVKQGENNFRFIEVPCC